MTDQRSGGGSAGEPIGPSEALARWARAQEGPAGGGEDPAPAAAPAPAATAVRIEATGGPEPSPFALLSLDEMREGSDAATPAQAVPAPAPAEPRPAAVAGPEVVATVVAGSGPDVAAAPAAVSVGDDAVRPATPGGGGPRARGWSPTTPGAFWRWAFPALIVVLALAVPVLVKVGKDTVLQSTDGRVLTTVTDPSAPGYQIITEPTPTMLVVQTDESGVANGLTVMSLTGETDGSLVFVPMTTVLALPGIGDIPLDAAASRAGVAGLQAAVEGVLGVGMGEVAVLDPQGWADLVAPLGSIEVDNPDDVTAPGPDGVEVVVYPKGPLTLQPEDVAPYLAARSPGENDLNRLVRQQAFWDAYLRDVGTSGDPAAVPGESSSGLGRFVRALAAGRVDLAPLPVQTAAIPGSELAVYLPVDDQVTALVARVVPFPVGAPAGARPRVRLLDGTGRLDHGLGAVGLVVGAGGQVDQIGNADQFGVPVTTVTYYDEARRAEAEAVQAALGVGEVRKADTAQTAIDLTVVLGDDYAARPPPTLAPVTTAPR